MANKITPTDYFERKYKRLVKKFPSLHTELTVLQQQLQENAELGTHLGGGLYKIRLASADKGKGKSGGFRVITYLVEETLTKGIFEVFLLTLYDKSEESSINKNTLIELIKNIFD